MASTAINYLFPSDQIMKLPTWRFVLHFMTPPDYTPETLAAAIASLKVAEWKIVTFPFGFESLALDPTGKAVGVPIEVSEERRGQPGSLADYESDVWKIMGNMVANGFGDLYYEAIDWKEQDDVSSAQPSGPSDKPQQRSGIKGIVSRIRRWFERRSGH